MSKNATFARSGARTASRTPTGCTRPESLFGLWAIEPARFQEMVRICKSVDLVALAEQRRLAAAGDAGQQADGAPSGPLPTLSPERPGKRRADDDGGDYSDDEEDPSEAAFQPPYNVVNGIALLSVRGPMTKYQTSFQDIIGGTATLPVRRALRLAAGDPSVSAVMICFDTPGGTVAGTGDLAADIRAVDAVKPCYAYIEDMCASAGYWAASQCRTVFANAGALVGCIGAMARLEDTSKSFEQQGIAVQIVTSDVAAGEETMKGAGADGTPITPAQIADIKRTLNDQNDLFVADVAAGRNLPVDRVRKMADGRVHVGEKAKALGLVDEIASLDAAMQAAYTESYTMNSEQFKAFAAANPEDPAVKTLIAQGHKAGKAEGLTEAQKTMTAMVAAFPGREKFAAEQFIKGHDAISAKADLADVLAEENKQLTARLAAVPGAAAAAAVASPTAAPAFAGVAMAVPGTPAANHLDNPAGAQGPDAIAAFETAWKAHAAKGIPQARAIAKVVAENPTLFAAYQQAVGKRQTKN